MQKRSFRINQTRNTGTIDTNPVATSGYEEVASLEELQTKVGFEVNELDHLPFPIEETTYASIGEDLAEISYVGEKQTIFYRKSIGQEDNSGDYNTYTEKKLITVGELSVELKGDNQLYSLAVWSGWTV